MGRKKKTEAPPSGRSRTATSRTLVRKPATFVQRNPLATASFTSSSANPILPKGEDQDRGNSGVFLMGLYEIQVLDSYNSKTYADGQASAVYGQYSRRW